MLTRIWKWLSPTGPVACDVCFYCGQPTTDSDVVPVERFDRETLPLPLRAMKLHLETAPPGEALHAHTSCMAKFTYKLLRGKDEEPEG